ncbi:hypothetical protein RJT34_15343 [Clitoria ternatea]|uniref:Uncharacterized protein n=1 Tax=Clitoria ternatea TaxID=43366 RepID=A0AAN9PNR0_CLITE
MRSLSLSPHFRFYDAFYSLSLPSFIIIVYSLSVTRRRETPAILSDHSPAIPPPPFNSPARLFLPTVYNCTIFTRVLRFPELEDLAVSVPIRIDRF